MTYTPPQGNLIAINFDDGVYVPPQGNLVQIDFSTLPIVDDKKQYIYTPAINDGKVGTPNLSIVQFIAPSGLNRLAFGFANIWNYRQLVKAVAINTSAVGNPKVENFFKQIRPEGVHQKDIGVPLIYNSIQYLSPASFDPSRYGTAYLIGGVRWLNVEGYNSNAFGAIALKNTTANQEIKPSSINSLRVPAPNVSPRILYAQGINISAMGRPDVRSPVLLPNGLAHSQYGKPTVWYHTRPLSPGGIQSYESGFPKVFDPTRFLLPTQFNRSSVFGDTAVRNKSVYVRPTSIFNEVVTPWAIVTNNRRYYAPAGIKSQSIGNAGIRNKTPSVFPQPITAPIFSTPTIGYRIRAVRPVGFNHLGLGRPTLTKTPELLPEGIASLRVSAPTVWFKNRELDLAQEGIAGFKSGNATTWFRYRNVASESWKSSNAGVPTLTHGVRNIITHGFASNDYGYAWVSRGTRLVAPSGIYNEFASNHMVGGTRYIKPDGYIATKWGTRIIPESQTVRPLGFGGMFGQNAIGLYTRYLRPSGYISVGTQPADRWGNGKIYNKRQYITQTFDGNNGLVPPKWSEWQSIQNRNRVVGTIGFDAQKFGYSQIDNRATPLLVKGISPPVGGRFDVSMIAHANRRLSLTGIEPVPISTWSVVHNTARVIGAKGIEQTLFGKAEALKTRRYYDRVGRIESFESGIPMISHRVRTVNIESRYSIAPPIIRLPDVKLNTRYVAFNGFETARYSEPSLFIRFNIIAPRWAHKDNQGEPRIHNVTPELKQRGHNSEEFGIASIRTQWRNIYAQGDRATLFGLSKIADTKQNIVVRGWQDTNVTQNLNVTQTGTNPYVTQTIWLSRDGGGQSQGIEPPYMPNPGVNQNVLYAEGVPATRFGNSVVHSNNLKVDIGISINNIPVGPVIYNKKREISLTDNGIKPTRALGKLRLSPYTIWATKDTPDQARNNHPGASFHEIDYYENQIGDQNKIGRPSLTLKNRTIAQHGNTSARVGQPSVSLKTRYLLPSTIRGAAVGIPEIPFTLKKINLDRFEFLSEAHGIATVSRPAYIGPQEIKPKSIEPTGLGDSKIDLLRRTLSAFGHNSLAMGTGKYDDTPYMWQGLRVGEHVPFVVGGDDMSAFGKAAIGLRIREIPVEGFVAFRSEYTLDQFNKRMKVEGTTTDYIESISVGPVGIDSMQMGAVGIKWGQQFIRPDGNSDQFRKGGYSG